MKLVGRGVALKAGHSVAQLDWSAVQTVALLVKLVHGSAES